MPDAMGIYQEGCLVSLHYLIYLTVWVFKKQKQPSKKFARGFYTFFFFYNPDKSSI